MARRSKNLNLEDRLALARRRREGEPVAALAAAFDLSERQVYRIAREQHGEGREVRDPAESVSFRAPRSELALFDREWRAWGYGSRAEALRAVLRAGCGELDVPAREVGAFAEAWRGARDLTDAGLLLAKAVARGRLRLQDEDRAQLGDLVAVSQTLLRAMTRMRDDATTRAGRVLDPQTAKKKEGADA